MFKKNSITQGDSLELLKKIPDKSIDLIFADPPYRMQRRRGRLGQIGDHVVPLGGLLIFTEQNFCVVGHRLLLR